MKLANQDGRAVLVVDQKVIDIATATSGSFGPDPMSIYDNWSEFVEVAKGLTETHGPLIESELGNPVPSPRQVFVIGLNYRSHAEESGMELPSVPATFTKFPASLTGPYDNVVLNASAVDWEVELVAVVSKHADQVPEADGWDYIAGLTIGQDISDRRLQFAAGSQFSLGKSRKTYGPVGPWVVSLDDIANPDDLGLGCSIDGETMQDARTNDLVFSVPRLVAELSAVLPLLPGDIIFTGTPAGIGATRKPARFLQPGETIESWVEGIGTIKNTCR